MRRGFAVLNVLKWLSGAALKVGTVMLLTPHGVNPLATGGAWLLGELAHALKLPSVG